MPSQSLTSSQEIEHAVRKLRYTYSNEISEWLNILFDQSKLEQLLTRSHLFLRNSEFFLDKLILQTKISIVESTACHLVKESVSIYSSSNEVFFTNNCIVCEYTNY